MFDSFLPLLVRHAPPHALKMHVMNEFCRVVYFYATGRGWNSNMWQDSHISYDTKTNCEIRLMTGLFFFLNIGKMVLTLIRKHCLFWYKAQVPFNGIVLLNFQVTVEVQHFALPFVSPNIPTLWIPCCSQTSRLVLSFSLFSQLVDGNQFLHFSKRFKKKWCHNPFNLLPHSFHKFMIGAICIYDIWFVLQRTLMRALFCFKCKLLKSLSSTPCELFSIPELFILFYNMPISCWCTCEWLVPYWNTLEENIWRLYNR